jgi:transglutaminase-like putative cysteine protease
MRRGLQSGAATNYPPMYSAPIPDGDAGVAQTITYMKSLLYSPVGVKSFRVRQAALEAVRGVERGQPEIDSVFNWVRDNIEFRGEFNETLQSPEATLNLGAGDCDDQSMLTAALLASLGYETRFRTVALRGSENEYSHVYAEVRDKQTGQWMSLDTTVESAYPGWEPDDVVRSASYGTMTPPNSGISAESLVGLGFLALGLLL